MDHRRAEAAIAGLGPMIAALLPEEGGPARVLRVRDAPPAARLAVSRLTVAGMRAATPQAAADAHGIALDAGPLLAAVPARLRALRRVPDGWVVLLAWGAGADRAPLREAFDALRPSEPLAFEDVFENAALVMAVIGPDRRLHAANRAGRRALAEPGALTAEGGWLRAAGAGEDERLGAAMAQAAARPEPVTLALSGGGGGPGLRCELGRIDRPLAPRDGAARLLLTAAPTEPAAPVEVLLAERYGLTGSEARLAGHLVAGRDLRAAGEVMGVSRHTARKYLQIVFSKMGVRRQADLVRRALRLLHAEAD